MTAHYEACESGMVCGDGDVDDKDNDENTCNSNE